MNDATQRALDKVLSKVNELKQTLDRDRYNLTDNDISSIDVKIEQLVLEIKERYARRG